MNPKIKNTKKAMVEYYGVNITLEGFNYQNNSDLKPSYDKGTSHKYLYLKGVEKKRRFPTRERMDAFINNLIKDIQDLK